MFQDTEDPFFGEQDLKHLIKIGSVWPADDVLDDSLLNPNFDEVNLSDTFYEINDSPDEINPFQDVDIETNNVETFHIQGAPDHCDETIGHYKISDWLEQTDRGWLDTVLTPSNADNICPLKSAQFRESSHLRSSIVTRNTNYLINNDLTPQLVSSEIEQVQERKQDKSKRNMSKSSKKKRLSLPGVQKTSLWKRIFHWSTDTSKSQTCSSRQMRSISANFTTQNNDSQPEMENQHYFVCYLLDDPIPLRIPIQDPHRFTLKQAKSMIPKSRGSKCRLFFKNRTMTQGFEQYVFDEIVENYAICPVIGNEIVCRVF
ncbi:hypothetical protein RF11_11642 [Thelohanellus kitauei]|uniref:DIX domain-containing protein n=1 Tax=Thelohanellus kitauei TaxID=669202 RepID=A0A0C2J252_THEKT|nr:hypothetical protein RF11_11642 [Thelohanellus kitauei]